MPTERKSRWHLEPREIMVVILVGILLLLCFILAGLFARVNEKLSNVHIASSAISEEFDCTDLACLRTVTRASSLMNKSVDPCENFYQFACGNYKKVRGVFLSQDGTEILKDVKEENVDRIISVLKQFTFEENGYTAEAKLEKFFHSCRNMRKREAKKGLPLLSGVLPVLGGWRLLGTWSASSWDLNTALKEVQTTFFVNALYEPLVNITRDDGVKRITLRPAGGMGTWLANKFWPVESSSDNWDVYKNFIRRVGSLLVRDATRLQDRPHQSASKTEALLNKFVEDVFTMEHEITHMLQDGWASDQQPRLMSLSNLTSETLNTIDWVGQISHVFNESEVSGRTVVDVRCIDCFTRLGKYLKSFSIQYKMKRMMHNYLIWRVLESYVQEMSWEYVHAYKEMFYDLDPHAHFMELDRECFKLSEKYMGDALNHLYITTFQSTENKNMAREISDNIRLALKTQLTKTQWMDEVTRDYAREKLDRISLTIGYPDWLANQTKIVAKYRGITIDELDHFGNLLQLKQLLRVKLNLELQRRGALREEWNSAVYDTEAKSRWSSNEVVAPAGILRFPIYDTQQPYVVSFGSLGSIVGNLLHGFVDERNKSIDKYGAWMKTGHELGMWWSKSTFAKYRADKQCVQSVYSNLTMTVLSTDNQRLEVKVNASRKYLDAIARTSGVRLALGGYKDWAKRKDFDKKMLEGLNMAKDQILFLAHAQTFCKAEKPYMDHHVTSENMNRELEVNMALGQMEEFSEAFQCKKDAKMNHAKKCQYL